MTILRLPPLSKLGAPVRTPWHAGVLLVGRVHRTVAGGIHLVRSEVIEFWEVASPPKTRARWWEVSWWRRLGEGALKAAEGLERVPKWAGVLLFASLVLSALAVWEVRTSWIQAHILASTAHRMTFALSPGASPDIRFPKSGPYDERLGYSRLPLYVERLAKQGYAVDSQARYSTMLRLAAGLGLSPTYREKDQVGLSILAENGGTVFTRRFPRWVYPAYDSIPGLAVNTLLFLENRELLDQTSVYRNPAVEWDRLARACIDYVGNSLHSDRRPVGGSTLATQIEKYRHSPGGRTHSPADKLRQILSASQRAYLDGTETWNVRQRIILDYVNSVPLAASPRYGEVYGLADGLRVWYGVDIDEANRFLAADEGYATAKQIKAKARTYKQVLSLFVAHRSPTSYLVEHPERLAEATDRHLTLLAEQRIISPCLRDAALKIELNLRSAAPAETNRAQPRDKAADVLRVHLLKLLGVSGLYDLDRLDLTVQSTLDADALKSVSKVLQRLHDPAFVNSAGLRGEHLLEDAPPAHVVCSFTLYERGPDANLIRVQTDNFNQPLNVNEGTKLELGSTAKLRTLITYLETVAELHDRIVELSSNERASIRVPPRDPLTRWALDYFARSREVNLPAMLEAAMQRRYSASPHEAFFTGGGLHTFSNFDSTDDRREMSVREAFQKSVNLAFIRLMRDIEHYYMYRVEGSTAQLLEDAASPERSVYLARFADFEGRKFLARFYNEYCGKAPAEAWGLLVDRVWARPTRLAAVYRYIHPDSTLEAFTRFLCGNFPDARFSRGQIKDLYDSHALDRLSLSDRGYMARIHPLELWTVASLQHRPEASLTELIEASPGARQEIYAWLLNTHRKNAQDSRIRTILEIEAFEKIHDAWQRLGYPFDALVPSLATAIGSSADRPAALAELAGIILSDGVRYPTERIGRVHFAAGTPYETIMRPKPGPPEKVMRSEVAALLKTELVGVVENGTARRLRGAFARSDGTSIPVGGKTGTGDNRYEICRAGDPPRKVQVDNRTATFVFTIGDRFFGTVTTYVNGPEARRYNFTSSLPVQILKLLAPSLKPLVADA